MRKESQTDSEGHEEYFVSYLSHSLKVRACLVPTFVCVCVHVCVCLYVPVCVCEHGDVCGVCTVCI